MCHFAYNLHILPAGLQEAQPCRYCHVNVSVNDKFIYCVTAKASNALNTLVSGKEESLQS